MSFDWLGARRLGVWALLVGLAVGPFGPLVQLHADAGDDPACEGPALTTGHYQARPTLASPRGRDRDGHCAICHWLHAVRSAALSARTSLVDNTTAGAIVLSTVDDIARGVPLRLSARAPPPASASS